MKLSIRSQSYLPVDFFRKSTYKNVTACCFQYYLENAKEVKEISIFTRGLLLRNNVAKLPLIRGGQASSGMKICSRYWPFLKAITLTTA